MKEIHSTSLCDQYLAYIFVTLYSTRAASKLARNGFDMIRRNECVEVVANCNDRLGIG